MICALCRHPSHGTWTCGVPVIVPGGRAECQCSMSVDVDDTWQGRASALSRYTYLMTALLHRRCAGPLGDDAEEQFAVALNDCRSEMSPEEEVQIAAIVKLIPAVVDLVE